MATSELVEQLHRTLECGICLDPFKEPRGLPCLHCFCHGCLETYCNGRKLVPCPTCKKQTTIPEEGVSGFPTHFIMNTLQETVDQIITARTETEAASETEVVGSDDIAEAITGHRSMPVDQWELEAYGLQNEQTRSRNDRIEKDSPRKMSKQFDEVRPTDNVYGFEPYSVVEISKKNDEKLYGVLRWMGVNTKLGPMAGIELEENLPGGGTNGTLFGNRYFTCEAGRAIFVKLSSVRPDSRFSFQTKTLNTTKWLTPQDEITTAHLIEIAREMGTRWQLLAADLKVPRKEILRLADVGIQPEDKCAQVLIRWQNALPHGNNGRKDLIGALENCERRDLVVKVLEPRANEITAAHLIEIAREMGTRWQLLAADLRVPRKEILRLADVDIQLEDKCAQVLIRWQETLPPGNNGRKDLIGALESCERHDLVVKVLEPRTNDQTTPTSVFTRQNPFGTGSASNAMQFNWPVPAPPIIGNLTRSDVRPSPPQTYENCLESSVPTITSTTHRGAAQGSSVKATANAAFCYKNFADAAPPSSYADAARPSGRNYANVVASNSRQQPSARRPRVPNYDNVTGNSAYQRHVGHIDYDKDFQRQHSAESVQSSSSSSQFVSLPNSYRLSLSDNSHLYSRPNDTPVIGGQNHQTHHPPNIRTDYPPNGIDVVAIAPIPRGYSPRILPTTPIYHQTQYSNYPGSSTSASRLARHGIKEPPTATDDDEFRALIGNVSLGGGTRN